MSATHTTNLGLNKPNRQDYVSVVTDINDNMDILDSKIGAVPSGETVEGQIGAKVPTTRKINNKALSSDVTIMGSDIPMNSLDNTKLDVAVGDLKSAFEQSIADTTGNPIIQLNDKKVIYINDTGENSLTPTDNNYYRSALIPCTAGDKFTISATGRTAGRPWAFVDGNGVKLAGAGYSDTDITVTKLLVTAPDNTAYLVINDRYSGSVSYCGETLVERFNSKTSELEYDIYSGNDTQVSGENILFMDGRESVAKKFSIVIEDSGSSYDQITIYTRNRNLFNDVGDFVASGLRHTQEDDGIRVRGTLNTSYSNVAIFNGVLPIGTYIINGLPGASANDYDLAVRINGQTNYVTTNNYRFTLDNPTNVRIDLQVSRTGTIDLTFPWQMIYVKSYTSMRNGITLPYQRPMGKNYTIAFPSSVTYGSLDLVTGIFTGSSSFAIDPVDINILEGENRIWSSAGNVDVTYNTDSVTKTNNLIKYVTPQMFGALGDGVHDDTSNIQEAIDYAIANDLGLVFPYANYLVEQITIGASLFIEGNGSKLTYNSSAEKSVVVVNCTTIPSKRGIMRNFRIDCSGVAKSGIEITKNINAMVFKDIQVLDVIKYGIWCNGGAGKFDDIIIRTYISENINTIGLRIESPDGVYNNILVIDCKYGALVKAVTHMYNFHPFNVSPELMVDSYGVYVTSELFLSNSYIDTCAVCFGGTGYVYADNVLLFWSAEYYTDAKITEAGGDPENVHPIVVSQDVRLYPTGLRTCLPMGREDKTILYTDGSTMVLKPLHGDNLLEGVQSITAERFNLFTVTMRNNCELPSQDINPVRRYFGSGIIEVNTIVKLGGNEIPASNYTMFELPSGCFPHRDIHFASTAFEADNISHRVPVEIWIRASDGNVFVRAVTADGSAVSGNFRVMVYTMYKYN